MGGDISGNVVPGEESVPVSDATSGEEVPTEAAFEDETLPPQDAVFGTGVADNTVAAANPVEVEAPTAQPSEEEQDLANV